MIYHGDCRDVLPILPQDSVDLIVPDPRPQANPDHPHTPDGRLEYDPGCFWCREITMQQPPGTKAARP